MTPGSQHLSLSKLTFHYNNDKFFIEIKCKDLLLFKILLPFVLAVDNVASLYNLSYVELSN